MTAPALLLPKVLAIVEQAGAVILQHYTEGTTVARKADASPVTAADEAGEAEERPGKNSAFGPVGELCVDVALFRASADAAHRGGPPCVRTPAARQLRRIVDAPRGGTAVRSAQDADSFPGHRQGGGGGKLLGWRVGDADAFLADQEGLGARGGEVAVGAAEASKLRHLYATEGSTEAEPRFSAQPMQSSGR